MTDLAGMCSHWALLRLKKAQSSELAADPEEGKDRAHLGVAGAAVTDDFSTDGILLVGERECRGTKLDDTLLIFFPIF